MGRPILGGAVCEGLLLGEFFHWWGRHLLDLVPEALRRQGAGPDVMIADASTPGLLAMRRRRRGGEAMLARLRLDDAADMAKLRALLAERPRGEPVVLKLPPDRVLERLVTLPIAAERDLDRVLGYDMERLTPFTAEEVYWRHDVQERDRARGRLVLRLMVVPRSAIATLIDLMAACGGRPDMLEAGMLETGGAGPTRGIKLAHEAGGTGGRQRVSTSFMAAACCLLLVLVLATPFLRQALILVELRGRLAEMAPRIAQVQALRARIAGAGAGGDAVAAETRRLGDALKALAALTDILPDDSYLTEFTMRERKMTVSGLGASAPKLISLLSADPRIRNPAFTAPVTRSETNHLDVFAIRAELAP